MTKPVSKRGMLIRGVAKIVISALKLTSVRIGDFLVVLKSDFDLNMSGEPYIALMLLLDLRSGKYISRVWNQTVSTGYALGEDKLMEVCKSLFCQGKPCLGHPISEKPFPRKIASSCMKVLGPDAGIDETTCTECSKICHTVSEVVVKEDMDIDSLTNGFDTTPFVPDSVNAADFGIEINQNADDGKIEGAKDASEFEIKSENKSVDFIEVDKKEDIGYERISSIKDKVIKGKDKNELKCLWCDIVFSTNSGGLQAYTDHKKREHFWGDFKCSKCEYRTCFTENMTDHIKQRRCVEGDGKHKELQIKCPECKIHYNHDLLKSHYESCVTRLSQRNGDRPMDRQYKTRLVECPQCFKMYKRGKLYEAHLRFVHFFGKFECKQCGSSANYAADLIKHMNENSHTSDPFVLCPVCNGKVLFQEFQEHFEGCDKAGHKNYSKKRRYETKPKVCPTCGKSFKDLAKHQKRHLRAQGLLEKKFVCDVCGNKYSDSTSLHIHMNNYCNKVPTACQICCKIFSNYRTMAKHKTEEHGPKLQCEYCEYQTAHPKNLRSHQIKHFDATYKCSYCDKVLKRQEALTAHERFHTGERPFVCEACGKGFVSATNLLNHKKHVHKIMTPRMKPIVKRVRKK